MKLPEDWKFKKGFSLIEIIMVLGLLVFTAGSSVPLAFDFYKNRQMDAHLNGMVQMLRKAQSKSMAAEGDSSFGVCISQDQYILFKGTSCVGRDPVFDEIAILPADFSTGGISEIFFTKVRGIPSATGDITLTLRGQTAVININQAGRINYGK